MRTRGLAAAALCAAATLHPTAPQDPAAPPLETFRNLNGTFQIDLPKGWRQVAPNEARTIGEHPAAPLALTLSQPRRFYAVGPVDAWLAGDFGGPWLYVVEQQDEWYVGDDYAEQLRASWRRETETSSVRHEVGEIRLLPIGTQAVESVVAVRTSTPPPPRRPLRSLDVHAPTVNQQITLSFACAPDAFAARRPEFERWLATLTFARVAAEQPTLTERLWTPILTGAVVGLVLVVLYRHTRRRR